MNAVTMRRGLSWGAIVLPRTKVPPPLIFSLQFLEPDGRIQDSSVVLAGVTVFSFPPAVGVTGTNGGD